MGRGAPPALQPAAHTHTAARAQVLTDARTGLSLASSAEAALLPRGSVTGPIRPQGARPGHGSPQRPRLPKAWRELTAERRRAHAGHVPGFAPASQAQACFPHCQPRPDTPSEGLTLHKHSPPRPPPPGRAPGSNHTPWWLVARSLGLEMCAVVNATPKTQKPRLKQQQPEPWSKPRSLRGPGTAGEWTAIFLF